MATLIIVVIIVVLSSALCSGAEAALFSVSIVKVRQLSNSNKKGGKALLSIRENMSRPIAAIVVLNNIANIVGSVIAGGIATVTLGNKWLGLFSGCLTFLVIIFSEIIPKTLGERYAEKIALIVANPVRFIASILTPVLWGIEKITLPVTGESSQKFTTNESEIRLLASIGGKEGVIEKKESDLIQRVFELNNTTSKMLMTPRVALTHLEGNIQLGKVKDQIISSEHSRIVVIDRTPDNVIGVAMKDELLTALLNDKESENVNNFTNPAQFVSETTTADELLSTFQGSHQHLGVVEDEYGGVSGVVTLEDVIEILTGEIVDETDKSEDLQEAARVKKIE